MTNTLHWHVEQGSDEWFDLRRGRLTASDASKLVTPTGRLSSSRNDALARVVAEAGGFDDDDSVPYRSGWMERGIQLEEEARDWYALASDLTIKPLGFVEGRYTGCSPDGVIVGKGKLPLVPLEVKCPMASTHIRWSLDGGLPNEHKAQVHMQMIMLDAPCAHFVSYHPKMLPLVVVVERDSFTDFLAAALSHFEKDCFTTLKMLETDDE